jgi:hypothetical protein
VPIDRVYVLEAGKVVREWWHEIAKQIQDTWFTSL